MNDIQRVLLLIRIIRKSNPITDSKNSFFYPLNFVCFHFIGNESTLFVVVIANRLESGCYSQDLDLIAVILELKRSYLTAYGKGPYYHHYGGWFSPVDVTIDVSENLSCLPRLQKTEQL